MILTANKRPERVKWLMDNPEFWNKYDWTGKDMDYNSPALIEIRKQIVEELRKVNLISPKSSWRDIPINNLIESAIKGQTRAAIKEAEDKKSWYKVEVRRTVITSDTKTFKASSYEEALDIASSRYEREYKPDGYGGSIQVEIVNLEKYE